MITFENVLCRTKIPHVGYSTDKQVNYVSPLKLIEKDIIYWEADDPRIYYYPIYYYHDNFETPKRPILYFNPISSLTNKPKNIDGLIKYYSHFLFIYFFFIKEKKFI